ncbi:MAG: YdiU family protein [Pseudomonadales bacterium]
MSETERNTLPEGLERLRFDNVFTRELPADPESENRRRQISGAIYSRVQPQPVAKPELVANSSEVAALLGLDTQDLDSSAFAEVFTGNRLLAGMDPHATCYGGHQFGNWAGQLGDGRAINLGEAIAADGSRLMLQLKGAGPTPYSRTADGLAVLRSSVREFLCSEAMHHLGVPTTRALSLTRTGESVVRDMLYDGHPAPEPGAVVCRVAPSFTRFGHFQILAARGELDLLQQLVDHTIRHQFPHLLERHAPAGRELTLAWFEEVCGLTVEMVVHWMRVGFVHGVMNTDNMSVLGLTIDYGPYGWLDNYDPDWTPNTTDAAQRRYRFAHQPAVAQWNLLQLANALFTLVQDADPLQQALQRFADDYQRLRLQSLSKKLGLIDAGATLLDELDTALQAAETDMTLFFRHLAELELTDTPTLALQRLLPAYYDPGALTATVRDRIQDWLSGYLDALRREGRDSTERRAAMSRVNPLYVLRNYLAQLAIDKAEAGDYSLVREQLDVLRRPYSVQPGRESFAALRPDWARSRVGCSQLSCSS